MFKIDISDFSLEKVVKEIKENGQQSDIMEGLRSEIKYDYIIKIYVNGINVLREGCCYPLNEGLKALNNLFYKVIGQKEGEEAKINFMAGCGAPINYLSIVKKLENFWISAEKGDSFALDFSESIDAIQAMEEIVAVMKEYRDICRKVIQIISPNNIQKFMDEFFSLPKTDEEHILIHRKWHQCDSKKEIVVHHNKGSYISEGPSYSKYLERISDDKSEHIPVFDYYYCWQPLEQAWEDYRKTHGITEEDIKKSIKEENNKKILYWINGIQWRLKHKIQRRIYRFIFHPLYEKKGGKIYYTSSEIKGADIKSFKVIATPYSKDKTRVYIWHWPIVGADIKTFEIIQDTFSKDKNYVYKNYEKIDSADPQSFVFLGDGYCKDKNSAWWMGNKIENADANTFESVGNYKAIDKNFFYYESVKKGESKDAIGKLTGKGL